MTCSCPHPELPRRLRLRAGTSRRDVLKLALGSVGMAALGPAVAGRLRPATGAPAGQKILVLLYLDGGCDTLNAVIPSTLSNYFTRRPTIQIPDAASLSLTGGPGTSTYRLHPELHTVRDLWNAGDAALVQRVGYPTPNLSHFESQDIFAHGVRGSFGPLHLDPSGWVARYASAHAPTAMGAVSVGMGRPRHFVGGTSNPLQVGSLASFNFSNDGGFSNNHAYRLQQIRTLLTNSVATGTPGEVRDAVAQAHELSGEVQTALAAYETYRQAAGLTYTNQTISRNLKDVAALIHGGFPTRVFYTGFGGFDTHGDQGAGTGTQATLFGRLDDALASFSADMKQMGQWDNVVVAVFTEFGRNNFENGSNGTDHAESYSMILVGGAVNGGTYGPDITDAQMAGDAVPYGVDFRDVWREIVSDHLGANPAPIFPETQPTNSVLGVV